MPSIQFEEKIYQSNTDESVLDCLLRHDQDVPSSCRSGICQTCLMRAVEGTPSAPSQKGLKPALVEQNYFMACSCVPTGDMKIALPNTATFRKKTRVLAIEHLSPSVIRLMLAVPDDYQYCAGQFLTLFHPDGHGRSYSLASVPDKHHGMEFHIHHYPNGHVSNWIATQLQVGDSVEVSEAIGECVYIPGTPEQPLLLIATGTGLAPLYGVLQEALHREHNGIIKLYHGSHSVDGLYLVDELRLLAERHKEFTYVPCVSGDITSKTTSEGFAHGRANDIALQQNPDLKNWRVYLCGVPAMVNATKRAVFLAGVSMQAIHSDPFVYS